MVKEAAKWIRFYKYRSKCTYFVVFYLNISNTTMRTLMSGTGSPDKYQQYANCLMAFFTISLLILLLAPILWLGFWRVVYERRVKGKEEQDLEKEFWYQENSILKNILNSKEWQENKKTRVVTLNIIIVLSEAWLISTCYFIGDNLYLILGEFGAHLSNCNGDESCLSKILSDAQLVSFIFLVIAVSADKFLEPIVDTFYRIYCKIKDINEDKIEQPENQPNTQQTSQVGENNQQQAASEAREPTANRRAVEGGHQEKSKMKRAKHKEDLSDLMMWVVKLDLYYSTLIKIGRNIHLVDETLMEFCSEGSKAYAGVVASIILLLGGLLIAGKSFLMYSALSKIQKNFYLAFLHGFLVVLLILGSASLILADNPVPLVFETCKNSTDIAIRKAVFNGRAGVGFATLLFSISTFVTLAVYYWCAGSREELQSRITTVDPSTRTETEAQNTQAA